MIDKIEQIGYGSVLQHGPLSDRIYLIRLLAPDAPHIIATLDQWAQRHHYSKIFCKIPQRFAPLFLQAGYAIEAYIPDCYRRAEDALFVSRFLTAERAARIPEAGLLPLAELLGAHEPTAVRPKAPTAYSIRTLNPSDAAEMAELYTEVFASYPFPIHDPLYLTQTMAEQVQYVGAFAQGRLAAVASSEVDFEGQNAEMTDFATRAEHTGCGLSGRLLDEMECSMAQQGITTLYTIARLASIPINRTFVRAAYRYSGTLHRNTHIGGQIESMNVFYKHLP